MINFVPWEKFPEVEMNLFTIDYPCYLTMQVVTMDDMGNTRAFFYETEEINGKWLLKTY